MNEESIISKCPNCGKPIPQNASFCPYCGQSTKIKKIKLFDFIKDFFDNFLVLDFKFFRTLKALLIPGKLTSDYFSGKIKRYSSPWRLFFISIIVMLIVFGFDMKMNKNPQKHFIKNKITGTFQADNNIIDSLKIIDSLENLDTLKKMDFGNVINEIPGTKKIQKFKIDTLKNILDTEDFKYIKRMYKDIDSFKAKDSILMYVIDSSNYILTSLLKEIYVDSTTIYDDTRVSRFDIKNMPLNDLKKKYKVVDNQKYSFKEMLELINYKSKGGFWNKKDFKDFLLKNINWFIILLMPFTALLFKLLYIRRKRYFIEHLVFNLHNHSALIILFTLFIILSWLNNNTIDEISSFVLGFAPGIYYIASMKRYYQQSWVKTIIKFMIFSMLYFLIFLLALVIYLIIAVMVI